MQACDAMTCGDVRNPDRPLGISETKMRLEWLQIAQKQSLKVRFLLVRLVVRDRIELSTFRFSEGLSSTREAPFDAAPQPVYQHSGLSGACGSSLAGVPTCAGECRLVRVTGVLASWDDRTCVALVCVPRGAV